MHGAVLAVKLPANRRERGQIKYHPCQAKQDALSQNYRCTRHAVANSLPPHREHGEDPAQKIEGRQKVEQSSQGAQECGPEPRSLAGHAAHLDSHEGLAQRRPEHRFHDPDVERLDDNKAQSGEQKRSAGNMQMAVRLRPAPAVGGPHDDDHAQCREQQRIQNRRSQPPPQAREAISCDQHRALRPLLIGP